MRRRKDRNFRKRKIVPWYICVPRAQAAGKGQTLPPDVKDFDALLPTLPAHRPDLIRTPAPRRDKRNGINRGEHETPYHHDRPGRRLNPAAT